MSQENSLPTVTIDSWLRSAMGLWVNRSAVAQTLREHHLPEAAIAMTSIMISSEVVAEPGPDPEKDFIAESERSLHILYPVTSKAPQAVIAHRRYPWDSEATEYLHARSHELSRTLAVLLMCQVVHHIQQVDQRDRTLDMTWLLHTTYENAPLNLISLSQKVCEN